MFKSVPSCAKLPSKQCLEDHVRAGVDVFGWQFWNDYQMQVGWCKSILDNTTRRWPTSRRAIRV
eukprot:2691630-Amphidinium_carterae.1